MFSQFKLWVLPVKTAFVVNKDKPRLRPESCLREKSNHFKAENRRKKHLVP